MTTPLAQLRAALDLSLNTLESELQAAQLPPLDFDTPHAVDDVSKVMPSRLYESIRIATNCLAGLTALIKPAHASIYSGAFGGSIIAAYTVATNYQIPNLLAAEGVDQAVGLPASVVGEKIGVRGDYLARILRMLAVENVFKETSEGVFANNRISKALIAPSSIHSFAQFSAQYLAKGKLAIPEWLESGAKEYPCAWSFAYGQRKPFFESLYSGEDRRLEALFAPAMAGAAAGSVAALVSDYPWSSLVPDTHLIDVGGGQGSVSLPIVSKYPHLKLTIMDLAPVLPRAKSNLEKNYPEINPKRVDLLAHSFFEDSIPVKGNDLVFVVRYVLHDWPYDECVKILKNLRAVMNATCRVLIMDMIVKPAIKSNRTVKSLEQELGNMKNNEPYRAIELPAPLPSCGLVGGESEMSLNMLACLDSEEKMVPQFEKICDAADLKVANIYYTRSDIAILECVIKG